jgi:hypothetical protein
MSSRWRWTHLSSHREVPCQVPRPGGGETLVRELDVLEVAWGCTWDTMRSRMQV